MSWSASVAVYLVIVNPAGRLLLIVFSKISLLVKYDSPTCGLSVTITSTFHLTCCGSGATLRAFILSPPVVLPLSLSVVGIGKVYLALPVF